MKKEIIPLSEKIESKVWIHEHKPNLIRTYVDFIQIKDVKNTLKNLKEELEEDDIKELAIFLHNIYEDFSKKENWKTQEKCRVKFNDLPEENKNVMLKVSASLIMRNNKRTNKAFERHEGEIK